MHALPTVTKHHGPIRPRASPTIAWAGKISSIQKKSSNTGL